MIDVASPFKWAKTSEVLDAAKALEDASPIRLAERIRLQAEAERVYREMFRELGCDGGLKSELELMLKLATEEGPIILESHSFRDNLRLLVARREQDYSSQGDWPDRIADALFQKRSKGGRPPNRMDQSSDRLKIDDFRVLRTALGWGAKNVPGSAVTEAEILQSLHKKSLVLRPPDDGLPPERVPPGYREQQTKSYNAVNLPRIARHLAAFRASRHTRKIMRKTRGTLDDHAIQIVLEGWAPAARYGPSSKRDLTLENAKAQDVPVDPTKARKELSRLKDNAKKRDKPPRV